ncbi:MAG: glycosyltransferase family 4 protein [Acaryochloris sp. RU_4_1]|nr:glycosyltransferase family 4 protein [Acaryochloris sp. RU_4_1]NJR53338.1 glycosyltransferase family 4 protein [Acaryochloris sp. CRU_2_0]
MKTLQIGMDWFPDKGVGGLERYYYDFIRCLPTVNGETVGLVTGSTPVLQNTDPRVYGFAPHDASIWQRLSALRRIAHQLLGENDYSLISSHFALYTFLILDQLKQCPLVVHFHGPWALESIIESNKKGDNWLRKAMEQAVFQRAANFIVLSKAYQDILSHTYQVPIERIHIVPGGIDIRRFDTALSKRELREKLGWPQERFIIFTARRLSRRMGLENLIAAMRSVCRQYPDVLLMIAGKGELKATLQDQIEVLELTHQANLLGYLTDQQLDWAYSAADLSVIPTATLEGFGLIVLESLAAGTPILGTPVGGIPEILQPFCEDLVFEGCSTEQLSQGIQQALSGERQMPSKKACQDYIQHNYTWPMITQKIQSIYQNTLDRYA